MNFINYSDLRQFLSDAADHYKKTAPQVTTHINDLYTRVSEAADKVSLLEIHRISDLCVDSIWEQPNYAANRVYHLRNALGMDNVGSLSF